MRDVKEEHILVLVLSAFLRAKDEFDQRERSESPLVTDVSVLYVRVVVLGVLGRAVLSLGRNNRLFRRCPRPSGIQPAPYDPGQRCTLPRQRTLVGCT